MVMKSPVQQPYKGVPGQNVPRNPFNLSYSSMFTADMGQLIPVMIQDCIPGDVFDISNEAIIRFQPMIAPALHEVEMRVDYYFVPNRIMWPEDGEGDGWESFITGGQDGTLEPTLPTCPNNISVRNVDTLWDYFGFQPSATYTTGPFPVAFPWYAYNMIWNEFYRDQDLQTELDWSDILTNYQLLHVCWEKDYFTSARPWQQRGTSPAILIGGTTSAEWSSSSFSWDGSTRDSAEFSAAGADDKMYLSSAQSQANAEAFFADNEVDLSIATASSISDLRFAFQVQKILETMSRVGSRYVEYLRGVFAVSPRDDRLQRPEYIGGTKSPVIFSEVLQTSQTDSTPQGTMAGHGINVSDDYVGRYKVVEHGLIIGLMFVRPKAVYSYGIDRMWLKETRYDYYHPMLAHLSEQAIIGAEIFLDSTHGSDIFGYQARWDEYRVRKNQLCSDMRCTNTYDYWHFGREFTSFPTLDSDFVECVVRDDIFAAASEPHMIVNFGNKVRAFRPLPRLSMPGMIDH